MRIGINARFLLKGKLEGIGLFTHEVMRRLVAQHPNDDFYFFFDRQPAEEFLYAENVKGIVVPPQARHPFLWYWWFEKSIPKVLKKYNIDIFISTDGYLSLKTNVPTIITIHDLAFHHYHQHLPYLVHRYFNYYTPKFAHKADTIVTVSNFTKVDIIKQYRIQEDKIRVVGNGCNPIVKPLNEKQKQQVKKMYTDNCNYFIYVGAIHPRKNIENLLLAFEDFKNRYECNIKLLLVGRWAWKTSATRKVMSKMKYANDVIRLGHLDRPTLASVLGAALALVYPSFFEGFGIPILEAMYAEVPIITSNTSSMPEVAGKAAIYIHPEKVEEISNAMEKMAKDYGLREHLIEEGRKQRNKFSWQKTTDVFSDLLSHYR